MRRLPLALCLAAAPVEAAADARLLIVPPAALFEADEPPSGPLHEAAALGDAALTRALLAAGADPRARDVSGRTPLHLAADPATAAALAQAGADPCATDVEGRRALAMATLSAMRDREPEAYARLLPRVAACR
jgi:ankyrin repeat protein